MLDWKEPRDKAEDLLKKKHFNEAKLEIEAGLEKFPNEVNLLKTAMDIFRSSGDHAKSLEYAELLITHHPEKWHGYGRAVYRFTTSQELDKAQSIAREGLLKTNGNINLISILGDIALAKQDQKMHDQYERLFAKKIFHEDMYSRLFLTPKSIKSRLKPEYANAEERNSLQARDEEHCDLYIVAGFSGCGKSTLLNSIHLDIKQIFSTKPNNIKILPIETIKFLGDLESAKKRCHERAMIFGTYFGLKDLPFLCNQKILPKQTLLHIDLTSFFLTPRFEEFTGIHYLTTEELKAEANVKNYISNFFASSFFKKFCSLSIATMHTDFDLNAKRYEERAGKSFHFDESMKKTYNQVLKAWHEHLSTMPTAIDNIITEENGFYVVRQKQSTIHKK